MNKLLATTLISLGLTGISTPSYAFSLSDIFGESETKKQEQQAQENAESKGKGLDVGAIAQALGGSKNPLISLAATKLGVPAEYVPHIETLYNLYVSKGNVASEDVKSTKGLAGWVDSSPKFDASTFAVALNQLFAANANKIQ